MKKILVLVSALAMSALVIAGCAGGASGSAASASGSASSASASASASSASASAASASSASASAASQSAAAQAEDPTVDNPIVVDKAKGEIRYLGFVDGAYVGAGETRHAVVFEGGSNGHKTIITGYGDEKEFYEGCMALGWKPGDNLTLENQKGGENAAIIEGELLDVTIRWDGQEEMPIWDCIEASNGDQRPAEWHFGGNIDRANEKNTGCVLCIDSCAVGIVSNAAWPSGTTDADGITYFYGKPDVLPADGTNVIVTFRKAA